MARKPKPEPVVPLTLADVEGHVNETLNTFNSDLTDQIGKAVRAVRTDFEQGFDTLEKRLSKRVADLEASQLKTAASHGSHIGALEFRDDLHDSHLYQTERTVKFLALIGCAFVVFDVLATAIFHFWREIWSFGAGVWNCIVNLV